MIRRRLNRLYIPFLIIFFFEILLIGNYNIYYISYHLLLGGFGPGSYYPVIMFQFIFLFPFIYIFVHKYKQHSIPTLFFTGVGFEYYVFFSGIDGGLYRLLLGRYIFVIGMGCYLASFEKINPKLLYTGAALSILYSYLTMHRGYLIFGHTFWYPYQAPFYFYTVFVFIGLMKYFPESPFLATLGKASWNIFLIQMVFFWIM